MDRQPLVTVVGGSGFVGRHLVRRLAAEGYRVRVLVRDTIAAEFLKTAGTPGQIDIAYANITRPETLVGKLNGSEAVVSLVSVLYQYGYQNFNTININGARAVAEEAKRAGVRALVHLSALGIEHSSKTTGYGHTKLMGEHAVRDAFPLATILRPSLIIGPEDGFFQRFARMRLIAPLLPLIGGGRTLFQPVLVTDVATCIVSCLRTPNTRGKTFEVAGPKVYNFRELLVLMGNITHRRSRFMTLPFWLSKIMAVFMEMFSHLTPWPPLMTYDQVKLLRHDTIATHGAPGLSTLNITPLPIEPMLTGYLSRFIKG